MYINWLHLGSQEVGVVVISHTSYLYNLGSSSGLRTRGEICQSQSDAKGFSSGILQFSSLCKFDFHAKTRATVRAIKYLTIWVRTRQVIGSGMQKYTNCDIVKPLIWLAKL